MSIEVRAKVARYPRVGGSPKTAPWQSIVYVIEEGTIRPATVGVAWSGSLPEAIQAVYLMRAQIERQLMDEVHASRARRRNMHKALNA